MVHKHCVFNTVKNLQLKTFCMNLDSRSYFDLKYLPKTTNNLSNPAGINLFKGSNGNTETKCEIRSKWTIKTPKRRINVSLLLTLNIFQIVHCWLWTSKYQLINNNEVVITMSISSICQINVASYTQIETW